MTNSELKQIFEAVEIEAENIFDIYDALADFEESYREMNIAKIKPSIYDAYELYVTHKNKDKWKHILNAILKADYSELIAHFSLDKLFDQIPEEYKDTILQLLEEYNLEN